MSVLGRRALCVFLPRPHTPGRIFSTPHHQQPKFKGSEKPLKQTEPDTTGLEPEERTLLQRVIDADGSIFQAELVEKSGLGKVKVTRVLDRLEGKGLVERKRRGMTNIVVLKR